jgi:hypothetical protein
LEGQVRDHHRFLLQSLLRQLYFMESEIAALDCRLDQLFSELLPFYGQLAAEALNSQFDTVVLDEAQDLLSPETLDLLGTLLKGGSLVVTGISSAISPGSASMEVRPAKRVCMP